MEIKVHLISKSENPLLSMAFAAKLCYYKGKDIDTLYKNLAADKREQERIVKHCIDHRHTSVLEHTMFMFGFEGVGRNFTHQLVRHRNTSYEQQSLHYIEAPSDFDMAKPNDASEDESRRMDAVKDYAFGIYKELIAEGMPKEEARHVLPSGIETKIVATANLRQWMHFINLRMCMVNCEEIRLAAIQIRQHIINEIPMMREYLGPNCYVHGVCIEGKRFCGVPLRVPLVLKEGRDIVTVIKDHEALKKYEEEKNK